MKHAIFSDVHANVTALERVLDDARRCGAERTICLGDVVGYGPDAEDAVACTRKNADVTLMGNHDAAVAAVITGDNFTLHALRGVRRHREETTADSRRWLAALPYVYVDAAKRFACAHGEFMAPEAFHYAMTTGDALASWAEREEPLLFAGHTHVSAVFEMDAAGAARCVADATCVPLKPNCRYFVNAGAVGYPRREPVSTYALYDDVAQTVSIRRLPFDYGDYARRMAVREAALPRWFEDALHAFEEEQKQRNAKKRHWWKLFVNKNKQNNENTPLTTNDNNDKIRGV